ncbi:hypothetical protein [Haloarcula sp. JP-L23]|uniref:hypothetical protein n=1 Tax=Haloarcula sp. JP-L23 TaxID=2716717 RepID=UPI00140EAEA6|nr:hypothetical protein G9465_12175 [Haloarcula sp. JP-L23]
MTITLETPCLTDGNWVRRSADSRGVDGHDLLRQPPLDFDTSARPGCVSLAGVLHIVKFGRPRTIAGAVGGVGCEALGAGNVTGAWTLVWIVNDVGASAE